MEKKKTSGTLYVVATPIGNLDDLSPRALETLHNVDLVLAEDTRHFGILKTRFSITTPVKSYHDHNESKVAPLIVSQLQEGSSMALVSDAGTPTISDPGYRLVRACREANLPVVALPGPCAAIAALSVSGFETDRFLFEGFLPQKPGKRQKALEEILARDITTIIYESPYKIVKTLETLAALEESRQIFLAREITKIYEECVWGTAAEVLYTLNSRSAIKGEFVIIVRKRGKEEKETMDE